MAFNFDVSDVFTSSVKDPMNLTSFYYLYDSKDPFHDVLYCGTSNGAILRYPVTKRQKYRVDVFARPHGGTITCLAYVLGDGLLPHKGEGLLVSGSADRFLTILYPHGASDDEPVLQKLCGHEGTITSVVGAGGGSFISSSVDGCFKMWKPQDGRSLMKFPFYECTCSVKTSGKFGQYNWMESLAVRVMGVWQLYVASGDGDIEVYRKGGRDGFASEAAHGNFTNQVTLVTKWKAIHRQTISYVEVYNRDNLLITLSYDATCKVSDATTGQVILSIANPRTCMFKGVLYNRNSSLFLFSDELGFMTSFSWASDKIVGDCAVKKATAKQTYHVRKSHKDALLGRLCPAKGEFKKLFVEMPITGEIAFMEMTRSGRDLTFRESSHDSVLTVCPMRTIIKKTPGSSTSANIDTIGRFSEAENLLFSVDVNAIFCWNEFDQMEMFQMRGSNAEITYATIIWDMNFVVTGHDDGKMIFWNTDFSEKKLISSVLKSTVYAAVEAHVRQSRVLVAADYTGRIAVWNLSLLEKHSTELSLELSGNSFHHREDPGILALAWHSDSKTIFSGGNDCTIRAWRLSIDSNASKYSAHDEPVVSMEIAGNLLLSGDMTGNIILWVLGDLHPKKRFMEAKAASLSPLIIWPGTLDVRAIFSSLPSVNDYRCYFAMSSLATNDIIVWSIDISKNDDKDEDEEYYDEDDDDMLACKKDSSNEKEVIEDELALWEKENEEDEGGYDTEPGVIQNSLFLLHHKSRRKWNCQIDLCHTMSVPGIEPTCLSLSSDSRKPMPNADPMDMGSENDGSENDGKTDEMNEYPKHIYFGTTTGLVCRRTFA